jgi:DNA (cytosine-5)-methyltransferase 1
VSHSIKTIDLFAGCGGLSLGLANAGIEVVAGFDNWEAAINVYRANFTDHPMVQLDLSQLDAAEQIKERCMLKPDMVVGGPPCQDYSHAGKRDEELGRADLTLSFARIVSEIRPRMFLMENVDRIVKSRRLPLVRELLQLSGYDIAEIVLDASYCGVPQKRLRYFMFGILDRVDSARFVDICNQRKNIKPMTVRDYFGESLGIEHYYRHPRNYARRAVYSIDEPSPTIRGVNRPIPAGYPGHHADSVRVNKSLRPLTTIERSYIQTFPKTFEFSGCKSDLEQMIGNSIPVNLAAFVGKAILEYCASTPCKDRKPKANQVCAFS